MAAGVLTHIQTHQKQPEGRRTAQAIEQRTIGDHAHAAFMQRLVAQGQWLQQLAIVLQHGCRRRHVLMQRGLSPAAGGAQTLTQLLEQAAIGLGALAYPRQQSWACLLHGQIGSQVIDIAQVQVRRHPARQQQYFAGNACGDIRVAITVAAHPRGETNRCGIQRQVQPGGAMQHLIGLAQYIGDGMPERMLDHRKAPLGFIYGARPATANFLGVPGFGYQPLQALLDLLTLGRRKVTMVAGRQLFGHCIVFLNQGAPRHFGGVCGQHQLDIQAAELTGQRLAFVAVAG